MISLGPQANFIIASYGVTVLIVAALIGWIATDYQAQRRVLADLEQRGVTRRSQRASADAAESAT